MTVTLTAESVPAQSKSDVTITSKGTLCVTTFMLTTSVIGVTFVHIYNSIQSWPD